MKRKTAMWTVLFLLNSWLNAPYIAQLWQGKSMVFESFLIIFVAQLYVYTLFPTIWKRIVQSYGTQSIAYVHQATEASEWVFERHCIRAKRIQVTIEIVDEQGYSFCGNSFEYVNRLNEAVIEADQLIVIRYFPFFKQWIYFDPLYQEHPFEAIVPYVIQRNIHSLNSTSPL